MSDLPDDSPASDDIEQPEAHSLMPDPYVTAFSLIALAANPRVFKARLRELRQAETAAASRIAETDAREAAFAEYEKTTRAELTAREAKVREQEVELASAKDARLDAVIEREKRISALERQWRFLAEDDDVQRGFRAAEFGALYKARTAYGYASDAIVGLDDIAEQMREKFPPGRTVRTDPQGVDFPAHVSLSRSEPEPEAPAGARIRGRRSTDRPATP